MLSYCMDCQKMNCKKVAYITKSGFVFVDLKKGVINSSGSKVSVGYHERPKRLVWTPLVGL